LRTAFVLRTINWDESLKNGRVNIFGARCQLTMKLVVLNPQVLDSVVEEWVGILLPIWMPD
jgi:hypothetical protein